MTSWTIHLELSQRFSQEGKWRSPTFQFSRYQTKSKMCCIKNDSSLNEGSCSFNPEFILIPRIHQMVFTPDSIFSRAREYEHTDRCFRVWCRVKISRADPVEAGDIAKSREISSDRMFDAASRSPNPKLSAISGTDMQLEMSARRVRTRAGTDSRHSHRRCLDQLILFIRQQRNWD